MEKNLASSDYSAGITQCRPYYNPRWVILGHLNFVSDAPDLRLCLCNLVRNAVPETGILLALLGHVLAPDDFERAMDDIEVFRDHVFNLLLQFGCKCVKCFLEFPKYRLESSYVAQRGPNESFPTSIATGT